MAAVWSVFGSRDEKLPPEWAEATARCALGSATLDASATQAGPRRDVRAFCLFGSVRLVLPRGSRVTAEGFSLFGSREVTVEPGDGPEVTVRATTICGSTEIVEAKP